MLDQLLKAAGWLDDRLRFADLLLQRLHGNILSRFGVRRHNIDAFVWPALVAAALWTAMPVWGPRLWISVAVALAAFVLLVVAGAKVTGLRKELVSQCALLMALGGAIWIFGPEKVATETGGSAPFYRHLLIPVAAITAIGLLVASFRVKSIFRPLQAAPADPRLVRYPHCLPLTELFQSRGERVATGFGVLWQALGSVLSRPALLLLPAAVLSLVAPVTTYRWWGGAAFLATLVVLFFAGLDERLDSIFRILTVRFFRNAALAVSLVIIGLAAGRWVGSTYVTTVVDTAEGLAIFLYLCFAYALTWWYDYWIQRMLGQQLLLLIEPGAGEACCIPYNCTAPATTVPPNYRTLEIHGLGRFLVYRDRPAPADPFFHTWLYPQLFEQLAAAGAPGGKAHPQPKLVDLRIAQFTRSAGLLVALMLAVGALLLSWNAQIPELKANTTSPAGVSLARLLAADSRCAEDRPAVLVAASGGGTRAAIFTAAVLEGISRKRARDLVLGSGVSGGAATLAYYAGQRPSLVSAQPEAAWDALFAKLSMPFIQDVIERSTEWRMISGGRLGILLAESFEDRWKLGDKRSTLGDVGDFGVVLNTTLAAHYDRTAAEPESERGLSLEESERRHRDKTSSGLAGGRLILTNLALGRALAGAHLELGQPRRLPVVIDGRDVRLERGAALSANFPPVFSNAAVDVDDRVRYWVTDGGAADNRGLEMLLYALKDALSVDAAALPCGRLPKVHVVVAEASAASDSFRQDRGIGSALGAGAHFAGHLNSELWNDVKALYRAAGRENDLRLHYVPMPVLLRASGSFGTHWMLQEFIRVRGPDGEELTFRGSEVVDALRSLYGRRKIAAPPQLLEWLARSGEFANSWCGMLAAL